MALLALDVHSKPTDALYPGHNSCSFVAILETSVLLYMEFEMAGEGIRKAIGFSRASVADLRKLSSQSRLVQDVWQPVTLQERLVACPNR